MKIRITSCLVFIASCFLFWNPENLLLSSTAAAEEPGSYLAAGIGVEQLTYKENLPDLEFTGSDADLTNWVLFLEGRKILTNYFIETRALIPLYSEDSREDWTRAGEFVQTNSLAYQWFRVDAHVGYLLHDLLNPYVGIGWSYAEQKRSVFENVAVPGIIYETATEEVSALAALAGIRGTLPLAERWSLTYWAEYKLPIYSNVTNDGFPGWEASDIDGYAYAVSGRLDYAFSKTLAAGLQVSGGRQHWEGSNWIQIGETRAKWPENDTDFISLFVTCAAYF